MSTTILVKLLLDWVAFVVLIRIFLATWSGLFRLLQESNPRSKICVRCVWLPKTKRKPHSGRKQEYPTSLHCFQPFQPCTMARPTALNWKQFRSQFDMTKEFEDGLRGPWAREDSVCSQVARQLGLKKKKKFQGLRFSDTLKGIGRVQTQIWI